MSAKYTCDVCGKKLPGHYNVHKEHEFVSDEVRVCFTVDYNNRVRRDICVPCAQEKLLEAAASLKKFWKSIKAQNVAADKLAAKRKD